MSCSQIKFGINMNRFSGHAIAKHCRSPDCIHAASSILGSLDSSVQPCDDFYHFACGKFIKETHIPADDVSVDAFTQVENRLNEQILTIMVEPVEPESESRPFVLAKDLYQSCLNTSIIAERGVAPLNELIHSYGDWPVVMGDQWNETADQWDWKDVITKFRNDGLEINQIFVFTVKTNKTDSTRRTIDVSARMKL